eukprot:m.335553 g.335553  ORF g.335553 m.335553 type:complete len:516 (+) comp17627_c0_seq1:354-1901(+)
MNLLDESVEAMSPEQGSGKDKEWVKKNTNNTKPAVQNYIQSANFATQRMRESHEEISAEGFGSRPSADEMETWMSQFDERCVEYFKHQVKAEVSPGYSKTTSFAFLDVSPYCRDAISAIVEDSFTQCFENPVCVSWDFEFYLVPLRLISIITRYCILLPIRLLIITVGMIIFFIMVLVSSLFKKPQKDMIARAGLNVVVYAFLWAFCAVVIESGTLPPRRQGQIYVANHSSIIDIVFLLKKQLYSLTGQAHGGLLGFFQNYVLAVMDNLWFDRLVNKDRKVMVQKIKAHVNDDSKPPLLVFPEGTCVNNEHVVMFKRGAFELGTCIVPVSIKYNKIFFSGYWNSRQYSFQRHLFRILTSWAVVLEVKYLDPQYRRAGESSTQFASRVKQMIAKAGHLNMVPWDGYLKYYKPRPQYKDNRQRVYARMLESRFGEHIPGVKRSKSEPNLDSLDRVFRDATSSQNPQRHSDDGGTGDNQNKDSKSELESKDMKTKPELSEKETAEGNLRQRDTYTNPT